MSAATMPRLSEDLDGPKSPDRCQACGIQGWPESWPPARTMLDRWIEHDDADRPTQVVVVLCRGCSGRIVEPHPRLYSALEVNRPLPGSMGLCVECRHRVGVSCPLAKANGGPGVNVIGPIPSQVHIQRSPRKLSGWTSIWRGPARDCDRREPAPPEGRPA